MLERLLDAVNTHIQVSVAATGSKPRSVRPSPRPVSAITVLAQRDRIAADRALKARFTLTPLPPEPPQPA